ncbi:MAG: efflux RND transporter periplasmic adaptor subunit [Kiritimatiellia bacterium]
MKKPKRTLPASIITILVIIAALIGGRVWQTQRKTRTEPVATFPAARGSLAITVEEGGTIHPREQIILSSELEGRNRILYLIPEGTQVNEGDLLVELDATGLVERRVDLDIRVQNAEAAFIHSRENLEVVRNQAQSDVESAELKLQFAREDLTQYREGEHPNRVKELEARITLAREELQRSRDKLEWSEVLFAEQYLAESEVRADTLAVRKAELDVELAENNLRFLQAFEFQRRINQLESDKNQASMAFERIQRRARSDVIQAEAELRARESEYLQNVDRLTRLDEQIAKARIVAPQPGLVIYATSTRLRWRGSAEPLAEGQEVNQRQELIHLPTAAGFIARIRVHESSVQKIAPGQAVRITASAIPGHTFTGSVNTIAPLPDPTSAFMNPDLKLYDTEILIDEGSDILRTGMSCQTVIRISDIEDAIFVPVHTVVRHQGKPTVFVQTANRIEPRPVVVGDDNGRMVHIIDGLAEGEPVLLAPPIGSQVRDMRPTRDARRKESQPESGQPAAPTTEPGNRPRQQGKQAPQRERRRPEGPPA